MKRHIFIICEGETPKKSWLRDASTFALFFALIGVGLVFDSSAMQWAGFFVAIVLTIGKASNTADKHTSADDAIARINEIKRTQKDTTQ